jgi:hypothetical protein
MTGRPPWDPSMSDGCSVPRWVFALWPEAEALCRIYHDGCLEHDAWYANGQDGDEIGRHAGDKAFRDYCLRRSGVRDELTGYVATDADALRFYHAVRFAGGPHYGTGRAWDGRLLWATTTEAP